MRILDLLQHLCIGKTETITDLDVELYAGKKYCGKGRTSRMIFLTD